MSSTPNIDDFHRFVPHCLPNSTWAAFQEEQGVLLLCASEVLANEVCAFLNERGVTADVTVDPDDVEDADEAEVLEDLEDAEKDDDDDALDLGAVFDDYDKDYEDTYEEEAWPTPDVD